MLSPRAGGIINLTITDNAMLHACFMPFVQGGALFVAGNRAVTLGEDIFVVVTIPEFDRMPITGKVVWINHTSHGNRPAGFGFRLMGDMGKRLQSEIEKRIAGQFPADRPTYTL